MKIVVIAQDSSSTWMLVNALRKDHPELKVILEEPVSRIRFLYMRFRRSGAVQVLGQLLFMLFLPFLSLTCKSYARALVADANLEPTRADGIFVENVPSVNSNECIGLLQRFKPDIVVVNGTRIISSAVLGCCRSVFFNTHCGITPAYRGVHGGYWALYQGDKVNCGVTVHLVNAGIDTGDIIYQKTVMVGKRDNFLTYPIKQYIAGIPLMRQAIQDVADGRLCTRRRDDITSALWYHPTLWQYMYARLLRGVR